MLHRYRLVDIYIKTQDFYEDIADDVEKIV